ncbi:MAG: hypothetical protein RL497_1292 [Pseudomonadota bacterium]|jgi:uncharacterized protein YqiB (DUF1249 family)
MTAVTHWALGHRFNPVNLKDHHAQCELNFHRFLHLLPGYRDGQNVWSYFLGSNQQHKINIRMLESAPYTSTLEVRQQQTGGEVFSQGTWRIRMYHDVEMAEVVGWDRHQHWHAQYEYPNPKMYQPDEKLALNRFLGEWLEHCRKQGICPEDIVIKFTNM